MRASALALDHGRRSPLRLPFLVGVHADNGGAFIHAHSARFSDPTTAGGPSIALTLHHPNAPLANLRRRHSLYHCPNIRAAYSIERNEGVTSRDIVRRTLEYEAPTRAAFFPARTGTTWSTWTIASSGQPEWRDVGWLQSTSDEWQHLGRLDRTSKAR